MSNTPTPHNSAAPEDFAKTVLMPGDPMRSKYIAEHFLTDARLVNNVRGVQGYTGFYNGTRVSVMASGMGMPSVGIYSYELYNFYGVENIIRVGSAGGVSDDVNVRDLVAGIAACTNSHYLKQFGLPGTYAPAADYTLLRTADDAARDLGLDLKVGLLLSSDTYYNDTQTLDTWQKMHNVLATEMEAAALYANADRAGKRALAICTISDCPLKGTSLSAEERATSFTDMMKLTLEVAVRMDHE